LSSPREDLGTSTRVAQGRARGITPKPGVTIDEVIEFSIENAVNSLKETPLHEIRAQNKTPQSRQRERRVRLNGPREPYLDIPRQSARLKTTGAKDPEVTGNGDTLSAQAPRTPEAKPKKVELAAKKRNGRWGKKRSYAEIA